MKKFVKKHKELIKIYGYIGIGVGYIGMALIAFLLIKTFIMMLINPETAAGVSLVLPGVNIPGVGVLPFWYWIITIFIIAVVHECSHGIVALANDLKIQSSGIAIFGPIIGAFVEPNEKQLRKASDVKQYSVFAAGSWANILLALISLLLLTYVFMPAQMSFTQETGISFSQVDPNYPVQLAGIEPGTTINGIDNESIKNYKDLDAILTCKSPGDNVTIKTKNQNKTYSLLLAESPQDEGRAYLGMKSIKNEYELKEDVTGYKKTAYNLITWFLELFKWLYLLSLGIGLFNLLPLGPIDGGRMMQLSLDRVFKKKKNAKKVFIQISLLFLIIVIMSILLPYIYKLLF